MTSELRREPSVDTRFVTEEDDGTPLRRTGVSVIVVTYRNAAHIATCAGALRKALPSVPTELIIVDNDSDDGTAEAASTAVPDATVIESGRNGGFAFGCQAGAARARGRWLLFVNPDAELAPGCVDALLDAAKDDPRAGIVGGRCVEPDGTDDPRSWWGRPTLWSLLCFATLASTLRPGSAVFDPEAARPWASRDEVRRVPVVTGALMLIDRETWERTGGLDTAFFMYGEEADLCLRAAGMGYQPTVTGRAVYRHPGGASSTGAGKQLMLFTGKATIVRRHLPRGLRRVGLALLVTGVGLRAALSRVVQARPERQGRPTVDSDLWRVLWTRRAEWTRGWSAV